MDCSTPGLPVHHQPLEFSQAHSIRLVMPSSHLILCHLLLLLPSIFPSIRVFSNESVLHIRWPKYWSFSFNISLSNEYLGLISFRMDWLDLLAVQGTLKSLLQHHSSKAAILQCSAFFIFFIFQLSQYKRVLLYVLQEDTQANGYFNYLGGLSWFDVWVNVKFLLSIFSFFTYVCPLMKC